MIDPPAEGSWNMAVDEALGQAAAESGQPILRFYSWQPATVSLGYFQRLADRGRHAASRNCAVVRRSTGGGAIVHDRDVTYSLAVPLAAATAEFQRRMVRTVHLALIEVLAQRKVAAQLFSDTAADSADGRSDRSAIAPSLPSDAGEPFLCFQRRSPDDVIVASHKVAGSAQRRARRALVQHGSIIVDRSPHAPEISGLNDLSPLPLRYDELIAALTEEIARRLGVSFGRTALTPEEERRAHEIQAARYGHASWTEKR